MKIKFIILASLLCLSAITSLAQEETRFKRGAWEISPFLTYVDKTGDNWGVGATAMYFVTRSIGVGGTTYWTDFGGRFFDNLAGEAQFRLPLFKRLAPYGVGSIGYQFDSKEWFQTLGAGADFSVFKHLAAFSDIQWRFANETRDGVFLRLGVRFTF